MESLGRLGDQQVVKTLFDGWKSYSPGVRNQILSIALYLGAFLLICGGLLYFTAYHLGEVSGIAWPTLVLGLPFAGLSFFAHRLFRGERQAVAVAFYLGSVVLLPLYMLIVLQEFGLWPAAPDDPRELLGEWFDVSNRQLQLATLAACGWSAWLALRTRTVGLSACFTLLGSLFHLALLADFGLREWLEEGRYDLVGLHLLPLLLAAAAGGVLTERHARPWFAQPLYYAAAVVFVVIPELLALDGRAFGYLGVTLDALQSADVENPLLLDTLAAMTLNGLLIYAAGAGLDRSPSELIRSTARMLFILSPFAILQPLAYLCQRDEYSLRYDWLYLGLALAITFLSHYRQRRAFYYAGLLNTAGALWLITEHNEWFDRPGWAMVVLAIGLAVLVGGLGLAVRERQRRSGP